MDASKPKYENVRLDEQEHDDSSTEVDESLLGDEKHWREDGLQWSKKRRVLSRANSLWWIIDTTLLLAILGLLIRDQMRTPPVNQWDFGQDFTGVGPKGAYES